MASPLSIQRPLRRTRLGEFGDGREADEPCDGDGYVDDPRDDVDVAETHPAGNLGDKVELEEAYQPPVHSADRSKNYRYNLYDFRSLLYGPTGMMYTTNI